MARGRATGETSVDRLTRYLFDRPAPVQALALPGDAGVGGTDEAGEPAANATAGARAEPAPFEAELSGWLSASPRFRAFVEANRDKIRKKLRTTPDPEARRDVRMELLVARLLTADKRIELEFEAYGSGKGGPDFTIAFPGERPLNLEVTRPRRALEDVYERHLLAKLRQLPPAVPNAILLAVEDGRADVAGLDAAVRALRHRADRREEAFFDTRGFDGARGFYELFLRLGGIFLLCEGATGEARADLWINRSARIPLPERPARACLLALRAR